MTNWTNFVKQFAKDHNCKYSEALKNPACSAEYKKQDKFVPVQDLAGNFVPVPKENITMEIKEIKKRGRPKKYSTAEEARKAKIAKTIASAKKRKETGKGIIGDTFKKAKQVASKAVEAVKDTANKVKDYGNIVIHGRNDYPPKVRAILEKNGDKIITGVSVNRTPLGKPLMTALQVASGNTFSQKLSNTPYDKLFHLFACVDLGGSSVLIEKNEVINAESSCKKPAGTESKTISDSDIPRGLTLNQALNKTKERMGGKFFTYSAKDNNCQDFIVAFLQANNIGNATDVAWVKQETKVLFEGNDRLRKIANTLTDIGAKVNEITTGAGMNDGYDTDTTSSSSDSNFSTDSSTAGGGVEDIDFEDLKWGSFSNQLKQYNKTHKPKLDLHNFAMMILANPKQFNKRTIRRARFYINVILKKGGMINELNAEAQQNPLNYITNAYIQQQINSIRIGNEAGDIQRQLNEINNLEGQDNFNANATGTIRTRLQRWREMLIERQDRINHIKRMGEALHNNKRKRGKGIKKSPVNNIEMPNNWISYVKEFAKKHNCKYSEALKNPACKAGYSKVKGGKGLPNDDYVGELYEQKNLGANGNVELNKYF